MNTAIILSQGIKFQSCERNSHKMRFLETNKRILKQTTHFFLEYIVAVMRVTFVRLTT